MTLKALHVDDALCSHSIYIVYHFLTRVGFEVTYAENGQEAIELAHTEKPDIILMDLRMPVMDGWEAIKRIRASEKTKHIPILVVTKNYSQQDQERAFAAGCDEFEKKPPTQASLFKKIDKLLSTSFATQFITQKK
ncbi:response regulator [Candidatus Albibeggiatoa sp. nov. NOAA]|uniref:response regulator n=1 Tax=Candidatus Albibeggiatoa sp. nov. NOAA TaxID=3162724 RepID=UPI0032F3626E|nr:response regulator [Thiotrichaceae bacterium]